MLKLSRPSTRAHNRTHHRTHSPIAKTTQRGLATTSKLPTSQSKTAPTTTTTTTLTGRQRTLFHPQSILRTTRPQLSSDKFGDTWTRQAKALGYPSRAVFKLIQAQKKFKIVQPGDVVVDLGCSPGSWSKLSSTIATGSGFVLGMDLTTLSPQEQNSIGVRQGDINQRFEYPKSYHTGAPTQPGQQGGLLASERKLLKARAPVGYMQQDVTQWVPGPGFQHQVDVLLSDMAPNTTGITSMDSSNSMELCYSVVELCSQLFKPPSTKVEQFSGPKERQQALNKLKNDPNHENVLVEHLTAQFNKNMEKRYGGDEPKINPSARFDAGTDERAAGHISPTQPSTTTGQTVLQHSNNRINLKMIKRTLKQHVYLQKPNAMGIVDTDEASAIYKTNERTLSQIKGNEHISTTWRGTLMMKVFQGEGMTDLMNILKQIFVSTYVFKPDSSRVESVEVFIVCKGYCGPFDHTRITNKHIRRPKTEEYLRSYVSNNRKRIPAPHDPSQSLRYHIGFTPDSPLSQPIVYDERSAPKRSATRKMSISDLYAHVQGGSTAPVSFTSDGFKEQEREQHDQEWHFDQIQRTIASGVTTNVHSAIKNTASLEQGAMSPLQREISESDDMLVFHREQFDKLYDRDRVVNQVPDTDALIKSMSLFWDEGINFAKKMAIESQSPTRVDIFAPKPTFTDQIQQDEVSSILDDLSTSPAPSTITASSIIKEHQRMNRKKGQVKKNSAIIDAVLAPEDDTIPQNPIKANLLKRAQGKVNLPTTAAAALKADAIPSSAPLPNEASAVPVKKTRGRPPRAVTAQTFSPQQSSPVPDEELSLTIPDEPTVKKRGPPKATPPSPAPVPKQVETATVVKKRGRPSTKVAPTPVTPLQPDESTPQQPELTPQTVAKERGRPPKQSSTPSFTEPQPSEVKAKGRRSKKASP